MKALTAYRKAVRIVGKNATATDYGPKAASSPEKRAAARAALAVLVRDHTPDELKTPELRKERSRLAAESHHYRFTVGRVEMGRFNRIIASADSFEKCLELAARVKGDALATSVCEDDAK